MTPIIHPTDLYSRLKLLPYQSASGAPPHAPPITAANPSRFKIGLWARQTGKDHTATAEAVIDCLYHPGTTWVIVAAGERQAIESLAKAKDSAEILKFDIDDYIEAPAHLPIAKAHGTRACLQNGFCLDLEMIEFETRHEEGSIFAAICDRRVTTSQSRSARIQAKCILKIRPGTEIKWSNGSRLIALPAHPPTVRGFTGSLILTEFAFNENADAIWGATFPYISNSIRGDLKKLRVISTPNGLNNKFADLWLNTETFSETLSSLVSSSPKFTPSPMNPLLASLPSVQNVRAYYKSKLTIHDAIKNGLPLNADKLRARLNDEDVWSQEYLCEFMDTSSVMFPYDLIAPCESEQATETGSALPAPGSMLLAGIDFGRKHHLTVCWLSRSHPRSSRFSIANRKSKIANSHPVAPPISAGLEIFPASGVSAAAAFGFDLAR